MADTPVNQEQIDTLQAQATDLKAQRDAAYDAYRITSKAQAATEAAITAAKQAAYNNGKAANAAAEAAGQPAPYPSAAKMLAADPGYAAAIAADAAATTTMAQANSVLSPLQASLNTVNQQIGALKGAAAPPTNIAAATTPASSTATAKVDGSTDTTVEVTASTVTISNGIVVAASPDRLAAGVVIGQPPPANVGVEITPVRTGEVVNLTPAGSLSPVATNSSSGATGVPYDDDNNLMPGWSLDEYNNPVWGDGVLVAYQQKVATSTDHGSPYDDNDNLMPGWSLDEYNNPKWVGNNADGTIFVEQKTIDSAKDSYAAATDHGLPYDDDNNLMPGWSLDEYNNPVWVGNAGGKSIFVEPKTVASATASREAAAETAATAMAMKNDWRIRLSLAPSAKYLYAVDGITPKDILYPLKATNGVVFPYSPAINTSYKANYDATELTHSNYKLHFYKSSSVDDVSITAEFTAQDTAEANYMLAVIHFFKSVTKMFYGNDANFTPRAGTPPPLLYLSGYGAYQFDNHPLLISNFAYNLPNDVDYIRAGTTATWGGVDITKATAASTPSGDRLNSSNLTAGGVKPLATFTGSKSGDTITYVPTKISITLSLIPVVTRNDISKNFSVKDYATGKLSRSTRPGGGGGIW